MGAEESPPLTVLSIRSLSAGFADRHRTVRVFDDLSLDAREEEFVAIVGKSGCGKSTLLRCAAGLHAPARGEIFLNNARLNGPDPRVGFICQDPCLFPWLSVEENIAMGPRLRGVPASKRQAAVEHHLRETGLLEVRHSAPSALSGGMKQRASIARTLANDPHVILMDEPFSALDSFTRASMQEFLLSLWEHGSKTILFVTHDIEEAIYLADRIVILGGLPARVSASIDVPFPRPRRQELKQSQEFFAMRNRILSELAFVH